MILCYSAWILQLFTKCLSYNSILQFLLNDLPDISCDCVLLDEYSGITTLVAAYIWITFVMELSDIINWSINAVGLNYLLFPCTCPNESMHGISNLILFIADHQWIELDVILQWYATHGMAICYVWPLSNCYVNLQYHVPMYRITLQTSEIE